jgi:hypothetical protein
MVVKSSFYVQYWQRSTHLKIISIKVKFLNNLIKINKQQKKICKNDQKSPNLPKILLWLHKNQYNLPKLKNMTLY